MVIGIRRLILLFKVEKTELFKENLCDEKEKRNFNISHNRHPCHLGRNWFCREKGMENCILFANEVNREIGNGGRFWVDTEYFDFAYEERFEEEMLQLSGMNVLERHMFEWPLGQFRDIHIPLMMLLQGKWGAETAIRFIKELRENGFVENEKYDLFPDA